MKYQKTKNKICIGLAIAGIVLLSGYTLVGADHLLILFAMMILAVICFASTIILFKIKIGSKEEYQLLKDSYMKYNGSTYEMAREDSESFKLYKALSPNRRKLREWDEELLESLFAKLNENDKCFKDIQFNINQVIDRKRVNTEYWSVLLDKAVKERSTKMSQEKSEERKHNVDPEINIKEGNFEHGGVRLIQTYLKDGEIAYRSEAYSVEERELDENGKEVFSIVKDL